MSKTNKLSFYFASCKPRSEEKMSSTSWSDGDQILAKSKDEKEKLEGFLNDIKNVAITFIPEEQKAFFQKWKRLKVSINHIFNAFDHLECVWDELKEEAKTKNSEISNTVEKPKIKMIDAEVQTEALEKEPENNEDEEVLDWRCLVDEAYEFNEEENVARKISVQSWSTTDSRSQTPELPALKEKPEVVQEEKEEDVKKDSPQKITSVLEEVSMEDSQSLPDLEDISPEADVVQKSTPVVPDLYETPKNDTNEEEIQQAKMTRGRKSVGLSATLPVSEDAPVKRKRGRPRKSEASLKLKKEVAIKGKTQLEKYKRKSAPGRTFPEKAEVKRSRRLEDTIQQIRRTRDNSFVTSVSAIAKRSGEPAGLNDGRPTPPPTPPVPSQTYEMEIFNQVLEDKKMFL